MKLVNNYNIHPNIVKAIERDPYTKGNSDYSITGLLKSARISELTKKHFDEIEIEAADRVWSLMGQLMHLLLERVGKAPGEANEIRERRYFAKINGVTISGALDSFILDRGELSDYKFITLWKFKDGVPLEMEQQQNCYLWLLRENGFTATNANIVAIYRDWARGRALRESKYPQKGSFTFPVKVWPHEKVAEFIVQRIKSHEEAKLNLPLCTSEERWAEPDVFAVKKPTLKNAVKLLSDPKEAADYCDKMNKAFETNAYFVEHRAGVAFKRCQMGYCEVSKFCSQFNP